MVKKSPVKVAKKSPVKVAKKSPVKKNKNKKSPRKRMYKKSPSRILRMNSADDLVREFEKLNIKKNIDIDNLIQHLEMLKIQNKNPTMADIEELLKELDDVVYEEVEEPKNIIIKKNIRPIRKRQEKPSLFLPKKSRSPITKKRRNIK